MIAFSVPQDPSVGLFAPIQIHIIVYSFNVCPDHPIGLTTWQFEVAHFVGHLSNILDVPLLDDAALATVRLTSAQVSVCSTFPLLLG